MRYHCLGVRHQITSLKRLYRNVNEKIQALQKAAEEKKRQLSAISKEAAKNHSAWNNETVRLIAELHHVRDKQVIGILSLSRLNVILNNLELVV